MAIRPTRISVHTVKQNGGCSALVLGGGDGARLHALTTTPEGEVIPKQYCSLAAEPCLLQQAVTRAQAVAGTEGVWPVVARDHERWWAKALSGVPRTQIIAQPENKGTGLGILLGLLTLERAAAPSTVLILPADQFVADEAVLLKALRRLTQWSRRDPGGIYLLGAQPEEADPALGYILPWFDARTPIGVYEFIERPQQTEAQKLINRGALWNTFIVAASRETLLGTYLPQYAAEMQALREAIGAARDPVPQLEEVYRVLNWVDFSHDILGQNADKVKVVRMPVCGWTELGTVSKIRKAVSSRDVAEPARSLFLDLAESSKKLESRTENYEMRAMQFDAYGKPGVLYQAEVQAPLPGPGQIQIRVAAIGVNPADFKWRQGMFRDRSPVQLPHIVGYDVAGVVSALGPGVTAFRLNQPVVASVRKAYAEFAVAKIEACALLPEGFDFVTAASLPCAALTGVQMIEKGVRPRPGESVLITGATGGVGRFALYAALQLGVKVVAAVRPSYFDEAIALGAQQVLALEDPGAAAIRFDHVADTVGGPSVAKLCRYLTPGGSIITVSTTPIDPTGLAATPAFFAYDTEGPRLGELLQAVAAGRIDMPVSRRLPLSAAAEAHRLMEMGGLQGKIILEP